MVLGYAPGDAGTPVGNQDLTASETGSGSDAGSLTAATTASETGAGVETGAIALSASESGSGADAGVPAAANTASDSGSGSDAGALTTSGSANFPASPSGVVGEMERRLGPEYWLPSWVKAHTDSTALLWKLLQQPAEEGFAFSQQARRAFLSRWLSVAPTLEPRLEWVSDYLAPVDREFTLTASVTNYSTDVRRAISRYDYESAVDPVYWIDRITNKLSLRNLFMRQVTLSQSSGGVNWYTISGESNGLVEETGIFFRRHPLNQWEWISPTDSALTGSVSTFILPASGVFQIAYGSQQLQTLFAASGQMQATWEGGSTRLLTLRLIEQKNLFDGYGALLGIPRLDEEPNDEYQERMLEIVEGPPDTTVPGVIRGLAGQFDLLTKVTWDGVNDLLLDGDGSLKITAVHVVGITRLEEIEEQLSPISDTTRYYATFQNWRPGYLVTVNGIPEPNVAISGNVVLFTRPVTGTVLASYSIEHFTTSLVTSDYIGQLNAGQGVASGDYTVLLSHEIQAHVVDLPDYQAEHLLQSNGLPNQLFLDIAGELTRNNPTTFGRARWGDTATWFEQSEDKPLTARLPIPFDTNES